MPLFTRGTRRGKPKPGQGTQASTYARNADEGQRAQKAQTAQQKRDWLERRRRAALEALRSKTQGRGGAHGLSGQGAGEQYINNRQGRPSRNAPAQQQQWPDEAQRQMNYGYGSGRMVRRPQFTGKKQVYPWPDEAARAMAMTAWQNPGYDEGAGAGDMAFTGGSSYQSGYGGGGYGGGRGGGGGGGYPGAGQRYSYLPEWLAKMAQWNI